VGIADDLQRRIDQHLVRRDSSVTTGVATAALNPDLVTDIEWWRHSYFDERVRLQAAKLKAFDILDPVLRGRGAKPRTSATGTDEFRKRSARALMSRNTPVGRVDGLHPPTSR
jgi:hypothetical protein